MPKYCTPSEFSELMTTIPVIDVRSPAEFTAGHIPGSYNIPLLNDMQRKEVGICYKEKGRLEAIELGFKLVGPGLVDMIRQAKDIASDQRLIIYCWRGGLRSKNMAWMFEANGLRCQILEGGYKAFRQYGKSLFSADRYKTWVLGGFTGSNKTAILHALKSMGEQVIDIEAEARHRGSSFGMIGQLPQYTNEQFENQLIRTWLSFDPFKRIWIEDESKILGSNHIPETLYQLIRNSHVLKLEIPKGQRAKNLVEIYGGLDDVELENAIRRIGRRLGGQNMKLALKALAERSYKEVAEITLEYYDKTYTYGLSKRDVHTITPVVPESADTSALARQLLKIVKKLESK